MQPAIWTLKELREMFNNRRKNQFDVNFLVTGGTGLGKSTLIFKFLNGFEDFNQKKQQVYSRSEIIHLLRDYKMSYCWADELISSAYKRTHYDKEQINLIETLTQYRCNFNIFAGALPVFFTLDKELLKLFCINVDVVRRGFGVIHMRKGGRRYSDDPWDTKYNSKLEEKWSMIRKNNPNFKIPYHKYSTFVGYLYWNDLTTNQRELYEGIRDEKKKIIADQDDVENKENLSFYDKLVQMVIDKQIDEQTLMNICVLNNKNMITVRKNLNVLLKQKGLDTLKKTLVVDKKVIQENKEILDELADF